MKNNAVCYLTNNKNTEEMERRYNLLPQNTDNYILTEIKNNLAYSNNVKLFKFNSDIEHINIPFIRCTYISLICFFEIYPNYDYYWLLEDDLIFNGDFSLFFNDTEMLDYDLLKCHGHFKESSNLTWYSMEENKIKNYELETPIAGGLACIQRWSNKLAKKLLELHNNKVFGHLESYPITIACREKMKIGFFEEIFKDKKYYIPENCSYYSRFNIKDLETLPLNTLIHAVKF